MLKMILPYAEFLAGLGCIVLAWLAFAPLKRYGASGGKRPRDVIFALDEMLILGWILLVMVGISLMVYPLV